MYLHDRQRQNHTKTIHGAFGVNHQLFSLNNRYAAEPRAGIRWKFKSNHSAGLSYGLHSCLEMLYYYFTKSANGELLNKNMDFTRAHHLVASYNRNISTDYRLLVKTYMQQLFSVPVVADSSFSFINLFDSRYRGGDGIWRNTRYNRSYAFNLLAGKE